MYGVENDFNRNGVALYFGDDGEKDIASACFQFKLGAMTGDAAAQYNYGYLLSSGRLLHTDYDEALIWLTRSAEQGFEPAILLLSYFMATGLSGPRNIMGAIQWLNIALNNGSSDAARHLGHIYLIGIAGYSDIDNALKYYTVAANNGNNQAMYELGQIYSDGKFIDADIKQAIIWLRMAAERGHPDSFKLLRSLTVRPPAMPRLGT